MRGDEADGGQHFGDEGVLQDEHRTKALRELGVEIIRFSNREILTNIDGVYEVINRTIKKKTPSPQSSPPGERK